MAKKKKESLSRTLAEVSKGVTKTVANDKSVSAKVRKQAKSDYRKASRKDDNYKIPRLNVSHGMEIWKLSLRLLFGN